jgi:hypothetical protein
VPKNRARRKQTELFLTLTILVIMFFPRNFSDYIYKTFTLQIETCNFKWLNGSRNWNQLTNFMGSVVLCLK